MGATVHALSTRNHDVQRTAVWIDGPTCQQCGKPSRYSMTAHSSLPTTSIHLKIPACWHPPKESAITAQMASACTIFSGPFQLEGVFPVTEARMWPCSPPTPNDIHPRTIQLDSEMQHEYSQAPPQCTHPKASSWAELTVMGINCGSLEKKLHQLYCYLILGMPDAVCLQEVWTLMTKGWLNGLPYQQTASQPFRGGGVIILVHIRRTSKKKWKMEAKEHSLCVHINPGHPDSLAIATVHFPPRMHPKAKAKHCEAVANFLTNGHATVSFIQGDLNDDVRRSYKGWVERTLTKSWQEFHCPYTTGP